MNEDILVGVLEQWRAAVDAHDPERLAAIFTEDAIFQGLHAGCR
jgi:ketosteroid isomerase-like protein